MKSSLVLFLAPFFTATALFAQAAEEPKSTFGLAPSAPPTQSPGSDVSLIPEGLPPLDKSPLKDQEKRKDKTAAADDALQQRIKLREAKTKALRDPAIQAEWDKSLKAKTEYDKREILKNYYTLLCARIVKIDPRLKTEVETLKGSYLGRFDQTRIAPTVPPQVARAGRN